MNIQWFPGHMTKTLRLIEKELPLVDLILELLDARIPHASKNPLITRIACGKPHLVLLNKADLADVKATKEWIHFYRTQGYEAVEVNAKDAASVKHCLNAAKEQMAGQLAKRKQKGMIGGKFRAMVLGVPNVGKSTFINQLAGNAPARTEDRPGVTRGKQLIALKEMDLVDMPGVLWPKFERQDTAQLLAFTGAIKDDVLDITDVAAALLFLLKSAYPQQLSGRYKLKDPIADTPEGILEDIAQNRGMLLKGGVLDTARAAIMLLDELRAGKLGSITFERPPVQ